MKYIDNFLNSITMYRLILCILICFLIAALGFSLFGLLPFQPVNLIFSTALLTVVCWLTNKIFAKLLVASTNLESVYITALILSLIITPVNSLSQLPLLIIVGILAISSKYILAINKKHIFNPTAYAVFISLLFLKFGASWWIGNTYMLIPVLIGGFLIMKKLQRFSLVLIFFAVYILLAGPQVISTFLDSPIFFFSFIMLTEPQTTPPNKIKQMIYGGLVGLVAIYQLPEVALLIGNIFSYIISPKEKLLLKLKEKIQLSPDIYDFVFLLEKPMKYAAGQYMEWTLGQKNPDSRGSRRYFTLASSPTEDNLKIGIKLYPNPSSWKKTLMAMNPDDQIVTSQLSGEFTLPKDKDKRLVFIAGGIGITPFRSMVKYLIDTNQKRDIILLYSNKTEQDIVYKDIFDEAFYALGIKTVYVNTDTTGFIDEKMIREQVSDFKNRTFYISGPHSMIDAFEKTLKTMGVVGSQIKIDFFPGYA